jgi:hypothetical protein
LLNEDLSTCSAHDVVLCVVCCVLCVHFSVTSAVLLSSSAPCLSVEHKYVFRAEISIQ